MTQIQTENYRDRFPHVLLTLPKGGIASADFTEQGDASSSSSGGAPDVQCRNGWMNDSPSWPDQFICRMNVKPSVSAIFKVGYIEDGQTIGDAVNADDQWLTAGDDLNAFSNNTAFNLTLLDPAEIPPYAQLFFWFNVQPTSLSGMHVCMRWRERRIGSE